MNFKEVIDRRGEGSFRSRLILATLTGKTLRVRDYRVEEDTKGHIGLYDYEIAFLKLIQALTNGSVIEVNNTGTGFLYEPGVLLGGVVEFDCLISRGIGYYLEMVMVLGLFGKEPLKLTLNGVTHMPDQLDISVDGIRLLGLACLSRFGVKGSPAHPLSLKILKRGSAPLGGGQILFECPCISSLGQVASLLPSCGVEGVGKVKRIRGIASCSRVSPDSVQRLVHGSRSLLNSFIPDIHIYTDVMKGKEAGLSPGFSLTLIAETTTGILFMSEGTSKSALTPEDLSVNVAKQLLLRISEGSTFDPSIQWMPLLLAALSSQDVVSLTFTKSLTPCSVQMLREIKLFLGVVFKVRELSGREGSVIQVMAVGSGYQNYSLKSS